MNAPVVTINNLSGGQAPVSAVTNTSQHQVNLFEFDGRDGALNVDNVLFVGEEFYNRAVLETATTAGGKTVLGSDAMVVYVQNGNNADNIKSATEGAALNGGEIEFNKAVNKATGATENFAVHGDDLLLGGAGADTILGGTGDDRIIGSAGARQSRRR
jgi:Ca2+-binding RTX toxin-like protein